MANSNAVVPSKGVLGRMLDRISSTDTGPIYKDPNKLPVEIEIDNPRRIGLTIAFLVFGVFGLWAALAPIEGAAHAMGTITVKSYKKLVQHLEGGIVKDILVRDGDHVTEGQTLLIMDSTQSLAQLEIANTQLVSLSALEARLIAERDGLDSVQYPDILLTGNASAQAEVAGQNQVFTARKNAREGEIAVLEQRIEQLQSQLVGLRALHASKNQLADSFKDELDDIESLLKQGFADKQRLREIQRNYEQMIGEAAQLQAEIASAEIQIGETQLQIIQTNNQFQTDVAGQLAQTQTELKDTRERITALSDVVSRTEVKAPASGVINGMQVHTIGGVISGGTPIAEIVPQSEDLVVDAKVSPADIDRVSVGQEATIRFSSFALAPIPTIKGTVINVSADAIQDQNSPAPYYLTRLELTPESQASLKGLQLVPGMPAEVLINSGSRTFLQYVMKPFTNVAVRSLRED